MNAGTFFKLMGSGALNLVAVVIMASGHGFLAGFLVGVSTLISYYIGIYETSDLQHEQQEYRE